MEYSSVLLALLMAVATCVVAQNPDNPCQDGKYLSPIRECLDQCPCGYYGNASRFCVQGKYIFFNQTSFNFKSTVNDTFDTPIISLILYIDKTIMTNESLFGVTLFGPNIDLGSTFFYYPFHFSNDLGRIRLKIENVDSYTTRFLSQSLTFNDANSSECVAGTRTLVMVRVEVYAVSIIGSFGLSIHGFKFRSAPLFYGSAVTASGTVDSGCNSGFRYDFTTRQCVASCPCGTHEVLGSCKTIPTVAFDPLLQTVEVHPMSKSGSTVATLKLWIDEAVLVTSTGLNILKYPSLVHHNFSDQIVPRFSHVQPLFEMSPSENSSISSIFYLNLNSATLPRLTASSMERCAVTSSAKRYVAISIDLKLLSDSLYHLGDHNIYMNAYLYSPNNSYTFDTILKLRVEAECPDSSQLYDFELHRCVSSCSCGYSPFRSHTSAYCEAVEYHASEFHDETYTVLAPNTRTDTSASIPLYVNLDSYFFYYGRGIVAHLEIQPTFRQPEVSFVQPDGSLSSTLEIVLNSSLEFTYCHNQLLNMNHTVYNVPIVVSPSDEDNGPVNYWYNVSLTHYSPNDDFWTQILQYDRNDSLTLLVNRTGVYTLQYNRNDSLTNQTEVHIQPVVPGSSLAIAVGVPVGVVGGVAIIIVIFMVIVVAVVGLRFYRERKAMMFGQFNNEENAYENVSMEETDSSSKANQHNDDTKHNDDTTVVMENVNDN